MSEILAFPEPPNEFQVLPDEWVGVVGARAPRQIFAQIVTPYLPQRGRRRALFEQQCFSRIAIAHNFGRRGKMEFSVRGNYAFW